MKSIFKERLTTASALLFFLLVGLIYFPSTGRDDSHITYWSAYALSEFGGVVNYNGQPLEQSSSLLHVLIVGILAFAFPANIVTLGYLTSIICGLLTIYLSTRNLSELSRESTSLYVFLPWLIVTSSGFMYWSFGGLESTLAALVFVAFSFSLSSYFGSGEPVKLMRLGLVTLMVLLVRPESVLVLLCIFFSVLVILITRMLLLNSCVELRSRVTRAGILFLLCTILIFSVRYLYTGMLFPLPVLAKSGSHDLARIIEGYEYFIEYAFTLNAFFSSILAISAMAYMLTRIFYKKAYDRLDMLMLIISLFVAIYILFIITSGGDWMEAGRFLVPILPLMMILVIYIVTRVFPHRVATLTLLSLVLIQLYSLFDINQATNFDLSYRDEINAYGFPNSYSFFEKTNRVHLRDIPLTEQMDSIIQKIKPYKKDEPVVFMSPYAGMVAFHITKNHYGDTKFIDMYGLSTPEMYNCDFAKETLRTNEGIRVTLRYYFEHKERFELECGIALPDIIMSSNIDKNITGEPYTIIYTQKLSPSYSGKMNRKQLPVRARMQIAVHNRYLDLVGQPVVWYW